MAARLKGYSVVPDEKKSIQVGWSMSKEFTEHIAVLARHDKMSASQWVREQLAPIVEARRREWEQEQEQEQD